MEFQIIILKKTSFQTENKAIKNIQINYLNTWHQKLAKFNNT
jgi:hypothetical protein